MCDVFECPLQLHFEIRDSVSFNYGITSGTNAKHAELFWSSILKVFCSDNKRETKERMAIRMCSRQ